MFIGGLLMLAAAAGPPPADVVFTNGVVVTLDPARPAAAAIAVRGGRIVAVGADGDVKPLAGPRTLRIDLHGQAVVPGLTDAHVHVESLGRSLEHLDLVGCASLDEALRRVGEAARALPAGEWLLGRGWDQNDWPEKRFPTAADLDRVAGDRPVLLTRVDGHASWANSKALALAGIVAQTPDPAGGRILRGPDGAPAGVLVDKAEELAEARVPLPTRDIRKRWVSRGLRACAAAGLTEVHDAGVDLETVALYKELLAEDKLDVRVYVMLRAFPADARLGTPGAGRPEASIFETAPSLRPETGLGDGRLAVRALKVVADGALGSRGALLLQPYSDEPGRSGLATVDWEAFRGLLREALARGFQVNTHAIGDAANVRVLEEYTDAFGPAGGARHRFRIEHAQVLPLDRVSWFKRLDVIPSMQPTHCTSDMYWAETRLGPERARGAYLWKTFLDRGVKVAAGSDAPVERVDALPGLFAAVTRQDAKGWPEGGWQPQERVTIEQALRMFTQHAAFAAFEEDERGSIAPGRRADLTVLTKDVTRIPAREILSTEVGMTVVGGRIVYERAR